VVPMRYRLLGDSGLRVSEFALGTMTFGEEWGLGSSKSTAGAIYDAFRDAGGNFFDTADFYNSGTSESFLSEFMARDRDAIVLATKYLHADPGKDPNSGGTQRKHLVQAIEGSLRRLRTDRIDLFWVNGWDFMTPEQEVMRGLDDLVRSGKVLYVGIANAPAWIVARCNTLAELRAWTPFVGLQVRYNLTERTAERDLLPMARALDIGIIGCTPLAGGLLTGKYSDGGQVGGRLDPIDQRKVDARQRDIVDAVVKIASESGYRPSQVALAWVRDRGVIPMLGARTLEQIRDNLETLEFSLSRDQMRRLNEASAIEPGFPHDFLTETRETTFGGMFERINRHRDRGIGVSGQ
jgi:aryl-alcohol dehydrogenase-like predicted oxidoreductase